MTRWVTHFCAPVFMFTAGIGAYFYWCAEAPAQADSQRPDKGQLSRFLITRGLWLIVLEVTVMQLAYNFDLGHEQSGLSARPVGARCLHDRAGGAGLAADPVLAVLSVATIVLHITSTAFGAGRGVRRSGSCCTRSACFPSPA